MRAAAWLVACAALCALRPCGAEYHVGDFVPTARRAQFHGSRTQWHDLLGRHCPKFGHSKTVAVPLPRPVGFAAGDEYKLALAFDGDRFLTQWLPVLGKRAPEVPLLQVELTRTGGYISAVHASSQAVPASYLRVHAELIQEFRNSSHWPKHVLVHYTWREVNEVDSNAGLYVLFLAGLLLSGVALGGVMLSHSRPLQHFFVEALAEPQTPGSPYTVPLGSAAKAD